LYRCLHHTTWWALVALIPSTAHRAEARTACLLALQLTPWLLRAIVHAARYLGIDRASLANNLLSSAIWGLSVLLLAALIEKLRKK
jgi:hypothetical protein